MSANLDLSESGHESRFHNSFLYVPSDISEDSESGWSPGEPDDANIHQTHISDSESDGELHQDLVRLSQTRPSQQIEKVQLPSNTPAGLIENNESNISQTHIFPCLERKPDSIQNIKKAPRLVNCFEEAKYQPGGIDLAFLEKALEMDEYDSFFQVNPTNNATGSDGTMKDPESERDDEALPPHEPIMNGNIINLHSSPISHRLQNHIPIASAEYLDEMAVPISGVDASSTAVNRPLPPLFGLTRSVSSPQDPYFPSPNNITRQNNYTQAQYYSNNLNLGSSDEPPQVYTQANKVSYEVDHDSSASPPLGLAQKCEDSIIRSKNDLSPGLPTLAQPALEHSSMSMSPPSKQRVQQPSSAMSWSPSQPWHYNETLATLHIERLELLTKKELIQNKIRSISSSSIPSVDIGPTTLSNNKTLGPSRALENLFSTSPISSPTRRPDINASNRFSSSPARQFHTASAVSVDKRLAAVVGDSYDASIIQNNFKRVKYEEVGDRFPHGGDINISKKDNGSVLNFLESESLISVPDLSNEKSVHNNKPVIVDNQKSSKESLPVNAVYKNAPPKKNVKKQFLLTDEQKKILNLVVSGGQSVFFTGAAGTGKSVLLRRIISDLKRKYFPRINRVSVTASTGLAACNIGGTTLHSFAGVGLGKEPVSELMNRLKRNKKAKGRWIDTKVLVIDEISMVDAEFLDKLDQIGQNIKKNTKPFGGIQLVITGDFYQLPPVSKENEANFAFEANCWNKALDQTIELKTIFRQKDNKFSGMLNEMRNATLSEETINNFLKLDRPLDTPEGLQATELFPTRYQVDNANRKHLNGLDSDARSYKAIDTGGNDPLGRSLLNSVIAPEEVSLKIGAQVMMIKNMDETLVNGSLGTVVGFMSESSFKLTDDGTKNSAECDDDDNVLRRKPKIEDDGFRLHDFECSEEENDDDPLAISRKRENANLLNKITKTKGGSWPYVKFHLADGSVRQIVVQPETWKMEDHDGRLLASRTQVPLILAWALSIHKAQGQTLEYVKVDLNKIFEKGQAYVALSRAVTEAGLQVKNFDAAKVMVHDRVIEFYQSLKEVGETKTEVVHVENKKVILRSLRETRSYNQRQQKAKGHITNYFAAKPKVEPSMYLLDENDSSTFHSITHGEEQESSLLDEISR